MENAEYLFVKALGIDEDCAAGAVESAKESGIPEIKKVKARKTDHGFEALVTDENGRKYIFAFGALGYLDVIRDKKDGSYLFANYD